LLMVTERAWLRAVLDAFAEHRHRRRHLLAAQFCLPLLPAADQAAAAHASSPAGPAAAPEPAAPSEPSEPPATLALEAASSALAAAAPLLDGEADTGQAAPVWQLTVRTDRYQGYGLLLGDDALAAWQALAPAGVWYGDRKAAALPT
ncbi:general secretion pathway protein GspL, partial [Acinetobacter baumannii]